MDVLYQYLTGNSDASYDDMITFEPSTMSAVDILLKNRKSIVVTLGGLKWEAVYLSNDVEGNPTLTLWLTSPYQDAFVGRSATEGQYYGYTEDGGLYSDWSANWSDITLGDYPSNMYGTSYIRAVTLNNGGQYATGNSTLTMATKSSSNVFAPFTMESFGLTKFLTTPSQIPWQRDQSAITTLEKIYTYPNEAIEPTTTKWYSGYDYSSKTNYTAWENDYLWLPSLTETAYYESDNLGVWKLLDSTRKFFHGLEEGSFVGTVGSTSGTAYAYSWLRSSEIKYSSYACCLKPSGGSSTNTTNKSYAVRPALHLNLKKIKEGFTYYLDAVNGILDGRYTDTLENYGTCDIYIDGVKVASRVTDYCVKHPYGTRYKIVCYPATNKEFVGGYSGLLEGTITGTVTMWLEFRTKTWEDYASTSYASGSGTASSPYIIKTPQQLGKLVKDSRSSNLSGKYYKLGANIDLSAHIWSGVGDDGSNKFAGNFNGDFYNITNIKTAVDYYKNYRVGLFSSLRNATIQNLSIKNCKLEGLDWVGTVAGNVEESTIRNIIVQNVTLNSDEGHVGGIAGTFSGVLETCVSKDINITCGHWEAGGITGSYYGGTIKDCSVINANLSGPDRIGLVYGYINSGLTLTSTYCQGIVKGSNLKTMYGDRNAWGNWSYSPLLNGGYPVQKTLFAIGGLTGSENVYNYLTETLKFSVV